MTTPAASTPKWRVSDEELNKTIKFWGWDKVSSGTEKCFVYLDLRDARALIAERDAEIARLRHESDCFVEQIHIYKTGVEHRELRQMIEQAYTQVDVARAAGIAEGSLTREHQMTCEASTAHCLAVWAQSQGMLGETTIVIIGLIAFLSLSLFAPRGHK